MAWGAQAALPVIEAQQAAEAFPHGAAPVALAVILGARGGGCLSKRNALFKPEGDQINIGLGTGRALDTFNEGIRGFQIMRVNR